MAYHNFRIHLANLEAEYCRLEAENIDLRKLVTGSTAECLARDEEAPGVYSEPATFHNEAVHETAAICSEAFVPDAAAAFVDEHIPSDAEAVLPDQVFEHDGVHGAAPRFSIGGSLRRSVRNSLSEVNIRKPVFADAEMMKEKVREQIMKKSYDVSDYYYKTGVAQYIARHHLFEEATLVIIALNAIWISIDTDYNHETLLVNADWGFQAVENMFCAYFTFELVTRFASFEKKTNCMRDLWFIFDTLLVVMMVAETWVMSLVIVLSSGSSGGSSSLGNVSVLRIARLLRLTRMARMARLLRAVPELVILIKGLVAAARSVFFTLMLLLVLLYVFSIAFKQLTDGMGTEVTGHFPDVASGMNTLWFYGTLLEEVTSLANTLKAESIGLVFLLDLYILAAALLVMNMLIGVLCEVVSAVASSEREEINLSFVKARVEKVFNELDQDNGDSNGRLSKVEFSKILQSEEAARAINDLGVDVTQLVDMADYFFEAEDADGDVIEKELSFEELMDMIAQFRFKNVATVKDIHFLRKLITEEFQKSRERVSTFSGHPKKTITSLGSDLDFVKPNPVKTLGSNSTLASTSEMVTQVTPKGENKVLPYSSDYSTTEVRPKGYSSEFPVAEPAPVPSVVRAETHTRGDSKVRVLRQAAAGDGDDRAIVSGDTSVHQYSEGDSEVARSGRRFFPKDVQDVTVTDAWDD